MMNDKKTIYGKAINDMEYGWSSKSDLNRRLYKLWHGIVQRVYSEKWHLKNPSYKNCTLQKEWHLLSNFVNDVVKIDNYELWLNNPNKYISLDKDIKFPGNRCYCVDKCMFVSMEENSRECGKRKKNYSSMKGKQHSEESKRKMSENHADVNGKNNPRYGTGRKVAQWDENGEYIIKIWERGMMEIKEVLGISVTSISKCCQFWEMNCNKIEWFKTHKNRPQKTSHGYVWKYYEED